jgi:hypothetical protein
MYDQGNIVLGHTNKIFSGKNYTDSNNPYRFADQFGYAGLVNPYWILQNGQGDNKNYQEQTQFAINVSPTYKINKNWTIADRFSYMINRNNEKYFLPKDGTPEMEVEGMGSVRSIIRTLFGMQTSVYNDFYVNWDQQFNAHHVNVLGGFRLSSFSYDDSHVVGYNNDNDKMPNIKKDLQYLQSGGTNDSWINLAYYLDANYNYMNKYYLQGSIAAETSSRFGRETESGIKFAGVSWGIFPSLQAGWLVSAEPFFNTNVVNVLKLRAGIDYSGNDNISNNAAFTYFENVQYSDKLMGVKMANIENQAIQWETTRRLNLGLDMQAFNNRLRISGDVFHNTTNNLLTL